MQQLQTATQSPALSVTDFVFDALYSAVVQLELPPGTRLSEAEVADRLKVSRQPVRDAFFRLAHRGFLLIRPQRATLVTRISEAEVLHATFIRVALETACIATAIDRMTTADLDTLGALLDEQARAVDRRDHTAFHDLDEAFHATLCEIAGQPKVWQLIQEQKGHMDRVRFLSLSFNQDQAYGEHMEVFAALKARDKATATRRLEAHLSKIRTYLGQIRDAHAAFFDAEG